MLKKSYFGYPRDIHLACIYIEPEGSSNSTQEEFNTIVNQILETPDGNEVLLCWDYNARTGLMSDLDVNATIGTNWELNTLLPPEYGDRYLLIDEIYNFENARKK